MNKSKLLIVGILLCTIMSSCEKDDLCIPEEAATPRLIILFKDSNNPLIRKPVSDLQVIEIASNTAAPLNDAGNTRLTQVDSIAIPLRINASMSEYDFVRILNGATNADPINFTYVSAPEYINRACGYKAVYNELTATPVTESPSAQWIRNIIVKNSSVTSNQDVHVEIRH
ncbi:DUF6452 family protein [Nonlabens antarcticus]|uniref:DUF6452 family protein n=1 Tax=Nonlabens antarcticus TaxID=392714 RepID=UPI0018915D4B|nr:DUF6452 family protein [Nonlabens antarcticus]